MTIVPVHSVTNLEDEGSPVEAEVALIYLKVDDLNKKDVFKICDFYRARKIENEYNTSIFEIAGTSDRIDSFIKEITKIVNIEIVRSGPIAISSLNREEEKNESLL
jgi:acetolactate synthase-1/3 small subunit